MPMTALVPAKRRLRLVRLGTDVTEERFITGVLQHVRVQVRLTSTRIRAQRTLQRHVSGTLYGEHNYS